MKNEIKRCIDAERAKQLLKSRLYETALNNVGYVTDASDIYIEMADNRVSDWIDAVPTADGTEETFGYNKKEEYPSLFECSVCEWYCSDTYYGDTDEYHFCPQCGAKILKKREFFRIRRLRMRTKCGECAKYEQCKKESPGLDKNESFPEVNGCPSYKSKKKPTRIAVPRRELASVGGSEAEEQAALFEWAAWNEAQYPALKLMFHVPNGGSRNKLEAANLKRQGVKAGVPDVWLPVARGPFHGLVIEMKAGNNKPTKSQEKWIEALREQGYHAIVCNSFEEAKNNILIYITHRG